jgi:hypothetical protein
MIARATRPQAAKPRAADMLAFISRSFGRVVYVAEEMAVYSPASRRSPSDVLARLDVLQLDYLSREWFGWMKVRF